MKNLFIEVNEVYDGGISPKHIVNLGLAAKIKSASGRWNVDGILVLWSWRPKDEDAIYYKGISYNEVRQLLEIPEKAKQS